MTQHSLFILCAHLFLLFLGFSSTFSQASTPGAQEANEQLLLGERYVYGRGVPRDDKKAVELFRQAAEQGNAEAQYKLGVMLEMGLGITQDFESALGWYTKAAKQGHGGAKNNIGSMYEKGRGVAVNFEEAVKWYRSAAAQGLPHANYNLGNAYLQGTGVPQNTGKAIEYFQIAQSQGLSEATKKLQEIEQKRQSSSSTPKVLESCGPTPRIISNMNTETLYIQSNALAAAL